MVNRNKFVVVLLSTVFVFYAVVGGLLGRATEREGSYSQLSVFNEVLSKIRNSYVEDPNLGEVMCRNIKTLFNFEPPVTEEEVRAASLQFVRKISGFNKPSKTNEVAFSSAVEEIARISKQLLVSLESNAAPKNRQEEAAKAKARAAQRFGG